MAATGDSCSNATAGCRFEVFQIIINCTANPISNRLKKPDPLAMKALLRRREAELQKIIKQMKQDDLQTSPVFRNLEHELESLKSQLTGQHKNQ